MKQKNFSTTFEICFAESYEDGYKHIKPLFKNI